MGEESCPDPLKRVYAESIVAAPQRFSGQMRHALLCIDLQNLDAAPGQGIFAEVGWSAEQFYFERLRQTVVPNVRRLQDAFRAAGHEVIHVRIQSHTLDGRDRSAAHKRLRLLAPPGSREADFLPEVRPQGDEIVINKTTSGVFESTNLAYILRNLGVESLFVAGVYTDECISTTVRVAADLGYFVTLVEDACTTVTPELHNAAVATLRDRYARVIDTATVVAEAGVEVRPAAARVLGAERTPASAPLSRSVVLLGGHALAAQNPEEAETSSLDRVESAVAALLPLFRSNREILIGHGNGPQLGALLARAESDLRVDDPRSLELRVAESEGQLGYLLQHCVYNLLHEQSLRRSVISVLTQTVVDEADPAFANPSKPIGPALDEAEATWLQERGHAVTERDGAWHRAVPSPKPREIVEATALQAMLRLGVIVIATGGGGVPVVRTAQGLKGVDAVVDKDLAGALLAQNLGADELIIVTSVPFVFRNFGTPEQEPLERTTPQELRDYQARGHFEAGTMAPKVAAACEFAEAGGVAMICDLASLDGTLRGTAGTRVEPP